MRKILQIKAIPLGDDESDLLDKVNLPFLLALQEKFSTLSTPSTVYHLRRSGEKCLQKAKQKTDIWPRLPLLPCCALLCLHEDPQHLLRGLLSFLYPNHQKKCMMLDCDVLEKISPIFNPLDDKKYLCVLAEHLVYTIKH